MMKKFYNKKDLGEYLNASIQYVNNEIHDFIDYQGSEIFESENDIISIDSFKNEGFEINGFNVYIASVSSKDIYCVDVLSGLIGKKWGELSLGLQEDLLNNCSAVDNMSETIDNGECIVDFTDYEYVSIYGEVKDGEISINDNAAIYDTRG